MVIPGELYPPKTIRVSWILKKKSFSIPERGLRLGLKIGKRTFWDLRRNFFFLRKKQLIIVFFEVKCTGDYRNVAIILTLFRDHGQNSKKPIFSSYFRTLTVIPK